MAANMTEMRVENTMVIGTAAKRGRGHLPGVFGAVAAILAVLLIGSVTMHHRATSHAVAPAVSRTTTSAEIRFLEQNTITLPNAVASDSRPEVVTSEQQKFLEVNTNLPVPASSSYMEEFTPQPGQPR